MMKKRLLQALTGACEHKREERGLRTIDVRDKDTNEVTQEEHLICLNCGEVLPAPTKVFRSYIKLRKHIRLRVGIPTDRRGNKLSETATYNVGLRYVVPDHPLATKRVWVTFTDKKSQKEFAAQLERRMRLCHDDEAYNEVINEALDLIRSANPEVPEQVVENGDEQSDE